MVAGEVVITEDPEPAVSETEAPAIGVQVGGQLAPC